MTDGALTLSYSTASPFARLVRLAVAELGLEDRVAVMPVTVAPGTPDAAYVGAVNPLGRIPALTLPDGDVLVDSHVIVEYLDDLAGGHRLIPAPSPDGSPTRHRVLSDHALAQGAMEAAVSLRYETVLRPEALRWPVWRDDQWAKIARTLDWFETRTDRLARPRAAGGADLAQLALMALLGYLDFRFADRPWREGRPRLANWAAGAMTRPSFAATAPDPPVA